MPEAITYVGMDAHKRFISVAVFRPSEESPVEWNSGTSATDVRRLARKLRNEAPGEVRCCYEAGPCGFTLMRQLESHGIHCDVIAPSLIPVKPGERIKTDRRDARKLGSLYRAGLLTIVQPPSCEQEAARDLCRCRTSAVTDLKRARGRLAKMLDRLGLTHPPGVNWTQAHRKWLRGLSFEHRAQRIAFDDHLHAIELIEERLSSLTAEIATLSKEEPFSTPVAWLRCFRGIDTVSAMVIVTELHNFERFESARSLMSYLGLVPSEHSTGGNARRGGISKTGNSHVRRALTEIAWHYLASPRLSQALKKRRHGQPEHVIAIANRAHVRLRHRYYSLTIRGKAPCKAITAVSRELAGFLWSVLYPLALKRAASGQGRPLHQEALSPC